MGDVYTEWIEQYVAAQPNRYVRGKCRVASEAMVAAFPELRTAAGFAHVTWGRDEHWWCVAPDGSVVDPTKSQFPGGVVLQYEELDLNDPATRDLVPIGRCVNCGEETYTNSYSQCLCSKECAMSYETYLNAEVSR